MIRDERATVLLVTLWLLAILSLLAIGIGFRTSIDLRLVSYQIDKLKAYEIAKAGIAKALSELEKDETPNTDTLWECGITLGENETFDKKFKGVNLGEGHFDISYIEDVQRKININTASVDVLKRLSPKITSEIADNIRAWRGDKDIPQVATNRDYSDKPYSCKNAPFNTVDELLLVKDMTQEILYGEGELEGIKDFITVYGPEGFKINVNTADQKTLEVLLATSGLNTSAAADIVEYRGGDDKNIETTDGNVVFANAAGLEGFFGSPEGGGLDPKFANFKNLIVFNSGYFKIRSVGVKSKVKKTITCVVGRDSSNKTEIISWVED